MHLKEVRMKNFKSFGEQLTVPLKPGFTSITGPNGSGKSNLGDAILFVLGPRSTRKLRAKTLTELIYNGGKQGKPAKECEVTLVFDNRDRVIPYDADDVELTRRIRRAPKRGDPGNYHSYCYVNERAASIGEFVDLLKHARISAEGYNIVTQGSVNDVVLMTDVDRRRILEEMAGITDFDKDVEAAEKKRVEVEQNLDRVEIILTEIRRSMGDLKRESENARAYSELARTQARLKSLFVYRKKDELERQIVETNKQVVEWENETKRLMASLEDLRQKHHATLQEQHQVEGQIASFAGPEGEKTKEQIRGIQAEAVRLEERINYAQDQVKELAQQKQAVVVEHRKVSKELQDLESTRDRLSAEAKEKAETLKKTEKELKELRELIAESSEGAMRVNADLAKLKVAFEETTGDVHKASLERDRLQQRLASVTELLAQLQQNLEAYELEVKECDFQLKDLSKESKDQTQTLKALEARHVQLIKRQAETMKQVGDLEEALRRLQREHAELKALEEASEKIGGGLNRAVEAILEARRKGTLKGVHGTIAELGKVDEKFELALQIAAGPRLQSLVVEDDASAAVAIEYLRKHGLGRAAFLPLNKMIKVQPRGKALMVVKDDKAQGFALDLIKFNKKYESAFSYVFGDTVVVSDLETARHHMGGVRLVTLQGDLIEAAGAMIGGSLGKSDRIKFAGKDVSKLAELDAKIGQTTGHLDELGEALTALREEIQSLEGQLSGVRANETGELRVRDLGTRRKDFATKIEKTHKDMEDRQAERQGLNDSLAKLTTKVAKGHEAAAELERKRTETGKLLLKGTKKEIAEKATTLEGRVTELKAGTLEAESGAQTAGKQYDLVLEKAKELEARLTTFDKQIHELDADAKHNKTTFQELEQKLTAMTKAESQLSGKAKQFYEKKEKLAVRLKELEGKVDNVQTKMATQDSLIFSLKNKLPSIEEELGNLLVEIKTLNVPEPKADEAVSLDEARKQLAQVDRDIAQLGPVNQRALEMFDEQTKRENELLDEVKRLQEQRENLVKVVEEITLKKKDGLMKVFVAVNENFQRVYKHLTGGGEAFLELENPEKPFEGGLVMKAQPVGKKVARLQSLSGGEKSMTALALIFALQEHEPSPFYLLDEVDQNLDGVNAELAARKVHEDSASAQFIVISLRKVTLKESDHLYGVTTAGNGLSQMIANFDISLISEQGEWVNKGAGGAGTALVTQQGNGSGGASAPSTGKPRKASAKKGIRGTVEDMMKVEVDK